jgi:type II secretory pathway component PulC
MNKKIYVLIIGFVSLMAVEGGMLLSKPRVTVKNNALFKEEAAYVFNQPEPLHKTADVVVAQSKAQGIEEQIDGLSLLGTVIGSPKDPIAYIKDEATNKQGIYRLGSKIREAKVVKIVLGEVMLESSGQTATLKLSQKGRAWAGMTEDTSAILSVTGNNVMVSKNELLKQSASIVNNLRAIKVKPHYVAAGVVGLRVEGITQENILSKAGLRNYDVIKSVNNQKIDSYQKALQVFGKVKNVSQINVCLLREGEAKTLKYNINN